MELFKHCKIYAPEQLPETQVLTANGKILAIGDNLSVTGLPVEEFDLEGRYLCPGFIDQHVHVTGGGGQFGFAYAKVKALDEQGLSAYMLTSYYGLPEKTLMGSVAEDLIYIDKVIGCKLALSDDRSSFPTELEILRLINQVRLGGFTSGKHGILHIHLGNLKTRIDVLHSIVDQYPSLISYLSPTHCIRTRDLFDTCVEFAKKGGMIDLSAGGTRFTEAHKAVGMALEAGVPLAKMTFSSDGHGGVRREDPVTGTVTYTPAPLTCNFKEMAALVTDGILPLESALTLLTCNPARNLSLKTKGRIAVGCDADFVVRIVHRGAAFLLRQGVAFHRRHRDGPLCLSGSVRGQDGQGLLPHPGRRCPHDAGPARDARNEPER